MTALAYIAAAISEIAGCFAFWAWLNLDKSVWWLVPAMAALALFAYLLTLIDAEHAGRASAAYGGVYIVTAIFWLWSIEGAKPDRWDLVGAAVCLAGAAIILFGPRSTRKTTPSLLAIMNVRPNSNPRGRNMLASRIARRLAPLTRQTAGF